jgi:methylglutaconyl-CoA hydratase
VSDLLIGERGPIVTLTLNRPERRNALARGLIAALSDALGDLAPDPTVRAVVLAASGPTFCAGMDLKEMAELRAGPEGEAQAVQDAQAFAQLLDALHRLPKPTIAAVQGDALAGGAGLALACDFVVMATGAKLGYPEVQRGLVPAIVLHDLVNQLGDRLARDLVLTGRLIRSGEAERWGLVNRLVPPENCREEALALAASLLTSAPGAITATKRLLDGEAQRPPDLRGAASLSAAARVGDEAVEGVRAFLEKRRPAWAIDVT